ncbi:MAG: bifunctional 4-hydroxy-3-methylbut-2-enyl diphosphate reductase/30S ribosomal protein S1 [Bacillota bacterium]|nr:bifunctional 4-hydroxy-3-methylbut-2-enyl diphosphate reductase/30S ribosomal protein S1 [Bacillota bacterium]
MKVLVAEHAGFCNGVKRAFKIAEEAASESEKWYTLGPLVHNEAVIQHFREYGIDPINQLSEIDSGGIIIRSHGVGPEIIREVEEKGCGLKDATCPLVKRVHDLAQMLRGEGYEVIVFGDQNHPEVKGIQGWYDNRAIVIANVDETHELKQVQKLGIISQTTKNEEDYQKIVNALLPKAQEVRVFHTICPASRHRQQAALALCEEVDMMLVIGDKSSSNTRTLTMRCLTTGVKTLQIETARDLNDEDFKGVARLGITAGASTPDWIIKEVIGKMTQFEDGAPQEQTTETTVTETAVAEETVTETTANEESFAKMEAEMADLASPSRGDVVKGTVIQVLDDEVMVDVGGKSEGIIPLRELSVKDVQSAKELVSVGDEIEVLVLKWDDDGTILLSKKKVDSKKVMDQLEVQYQGGNVVEGTVVGAVKGGLLVDIGIVAFLPASHVEDGYVKNLEEYVGKEFSFKIIEFNRNKKRGSQIVVSRKELVEAEKGKLKEEFWAQIDEGQVVTGHVKRIVDYGAFIDLGGFEGLLHVSEMDHVRIDHPSSVVSEGDEIQVYILALDREKQRVSLSRKKLLKSPWEIVVEKYQEGDVIEGTVVRIAPFGAFVEIEPGVDGLVHISQLADRRVEKPQDVVSVDEKVSVKILSIDPEEKRIGLSIKEAKENVKEVEVQEYLDNQEQE